RHRRQHRRRPDLYSADADTLRHPRPTRRRSWCGRAGPVLLHFPLRPNFNIRAMLGRKSVDGLENRWVRSKSFGRHNKFGMQIPSVIFDDPNQADPSEAIRCIEGLVGRAITAVANNRDVLVMSRHSLDPFQ
ncbi:MAG: hypothetical protein WA188_07185, partial [Terriglobales bacterium]